VDLLAYKIGAPPDLVSRAVMALTQALSAAASERGSTYVAWEALEGAAREHLSEAALQHGEAWGGVGWGGVGWGGVGWGGWVGWVGGGGDELPRQELIQCPNGDTAAHVSCLHSLRFEKDFFLEKIAD
jgi:hypothetical protein